MQIDSKCEVTQKQAKTEKNGSVLFSSLERKCSKTGFGQPHFSHEEERVVWFEGVNSLSIVNLTDLSQVYVDNLLGSRAELGQEPISVVCDSERDKILVHYQIGNEDLLVYIEKTKKVKVKIGQGNFAKIHEVECLNLSRDKRVGFLGGAWSVVEEDKGLIEMKATIVAFGFDRKMDVIVQHFFDENCSKVYALKFKEDGKGKRMGPDGNVEVMFVMTDGPFLVIEFDKLEMKFEVLAKIDVLGIDGKLDFLTC